MKNRNCFWRITKAWGLLAAMAIIVCFAGCSSEEREDRYETLRDALEGYYTQIDSSTEEEKKEQLLQELHDFVMQDFQGEYYYHMDNSQGWGESMRREYPTWFTDERDVRTIFIVSDELAYVFPYTESELEEKGITEENLDNADDIYKYAIKEVSTEEITGDVGNTATIVLESQYVVNQNKETADPVFEEIEIGYYYDRYDEDDSGYYEMYGYFADMITEEDDVTDSTINLSSGISSKRKYFRNSEDADAYSDERVAKVLKMIQEAEEQAAENEKSSESIPKVGMTADEVKKTKWGSPDKINKDTYSWGTTEQWVYDEYGYVYFEDGVVTSVSER